MLDVVMGDKLALLLAIQATAILSFGIISPNFIDPHLWRLNFNCSARICNCIVWSKYFKWVVTSIFLQKCVYTFRFDEFHKKVTSKRKMNVKTTIFRMWFTVTIISNDCPMSKRFSNAQQTLSEKLCFCSKHILVDQPARRVHRVM